MKKRLKAVGYFFDMYGVNQNKFLENIDIFLFF